MESKKVYVKSEFAEKVFGYVLAAMVILTVLGGCLLQSWLIVLGIFGFIGVLFMWLFLPGSCYTNDCGVVAEMPFQGTRIIPYGDITDAFITLGLGAKPNNYSEKRELIHTLHIITKGGEFTYKLKSPSGYIDSPMALAMELPRAAALSKSPFAEIVSMVRANCGEDNLEGYLYR
ncbi:MAG: hypothetical protein K6B74_00040 [Ruminococcus sp.]|nr:hypothetical protein [Ruminococcus sp.]